MTLNGGKTYVYIKILITAVIAITPILSGFIILYGRIERLEWMVIKLDEAEFLTYEQGELHYDYIGSRIDSLRDEVLTNIQCVQRAQKVHK